MNFARRPIAESGLTARLGFEDIRHGYGQGDVVKGVSLSAAANSAYARTPRAQKCRRTGHLSSGSGGRTRRGRNVGSGDEFGAQNKGGSTERS